LVKIGSGSHVYEIAEEWGKLPKGIRYGYTNGVVVDSQDRVYVHSRSKDAVIVFNREGEFLTSWGEDFSRGAHGMFLHMEGEIEYLYLADPERHIVVKTTIEGKVIYTLGIPDCPNVYDTAHRYGPTDVAVAPNGDFYICDGYGQSWIHHYDPFGRLIQSWGGQGSEPGKMNCPHGIWIDTRGSEALVYVADRVNSRVQVFTLDGKYVKIISNGIDFPCCFYESEGNLYIPDLHGRVTILDREDRLITQLGEDQVAWKKPGWPRRPASELKPNKFVSPHAVGIDSHGDLYVAEWLPYGRLMKLIRS